MPCWPAPAAEAVRTALNVFLFLASFLGLARSKSPWMSLVSQKKMEKDLARGGLE